MWKCHAMIGTSDQRWLRSVVVTDSGTGDAPCWLRSSPRHCQAISAIVDRVSADKAYGSSFNFGLIESLGAPFVPFKSNSVGNSKSAIWNRLFHFFQFNKEGSPAYTSGPTWSPRSSAIKRQFRRHDSQQDSGCSAERSVAEGAVSQHRVRHSRNPRIRSHRHVSGNRSAQCG